MGSDCGNGRGNGNGDETGTGWDYCGTMIGNPLRCWSLGQWRLME